jgi:hypothetical protein
MRFALLTAAAALLSLTACSAPNLVVDDVAVDWQPDSWRNAKVSVANQGNARAEEVTVRVAALAEDGSTLAEQLCQFRYISADTRALCNREFSSLRDTVANLDDARQLRVTVEATHDGDNYRAERTSDLAIRTARN